MGSWQPSGRQLYVSNLDPLTTPVDLHFHFGAFYPFYTKDISCSPSDLCSCLSFSSYNDALEAYNALDHTVLKGRRIQITWFYPHLPTLINSGEGNLYVKNLGGWVTSAILFNLFKHFGWVISCKVVTNDGICKGFGFVQMSSECAAQFAITALHDKIYLGRSPKKLYVAKFVRKSERQANPEEPNLSTLYVKIQSSETTEDSLREKFSAFGEVLNATVARDENGVSRKFGFVSFRSKEEAEYAKGMMHDTEIDGETIYVDWELSQKRLELNVFVKGLDCSINDNKLKELFAECEGIHSAKVICNDDGESKGFGFVTFASPENAKKAIANFHGKMFNEKKLFVSRALSKKDWLAQRQLSNVYVNYLDKKVNDETLHKHFASCGSIISAKVMRDEHGESMGFGFVSFECPEQAKNAIDELNRSEFYGKRLYVAIAQRKIDREYFKMLPNKRAMHNSNRTNHSHVENPPEHSQPFYQNQNMNNIRVQPEYASYASQPCYPNQYMQPPQNMNNTGGYPEYAQVPRPIYPNQYRHLENMNNNSGPFMHPDMNNNRVHPGHDPYVSQYYNMHPPQYMNYNRGNTGMQPNWGRRPCARSRARRNIPPRLRGRRFDHGECSNTYAQYRRPWNLAPRDFKSKQRPGESNSTNSQPRAPENNAPTCWKVKGVSSTANAPRDDKKNNPPQYRRMEKGECSNANAPRDEKKGKLIIKE